jgi:hypothetical protein
MNRRTFLRGLLLTAAGLAVPPLALDKPVRRLWALDGTMLGAEAAQPEIVTVDLLTEAKAFQSNMESAAAAWAESAGRVFDAVKEGVDGLNALMAFHAPTPETVDVFLSDCQGGRGVYPIARVIRGTEGALSVAGDGYSYVIDYGGVSPSRSPRTIQGRDRA